MTPHRDLRVVSDVLAEDVPLPLDLPPAPVALPRWLVVGVCGGVGATSLATALGERSSSAVEVVEGPSCPSCRAVTFAGLLSRDRVALVTRADRLGEAVELADLYPEVVALVVSQLTPEKLTPPVQWQMHAAGRWVSYVLPYVRDLGAGFEGRRWSSGYEARSARRWSEVVGQVAQGLAEPVAVPV